MGNFETHSFYCLKCGNRALPLARRRSRKRGKFHRKKLYCYHCQQEINCVECTTDEEVKEFKEMFKNNVFIEEAEESLNYIANEVLI